MTNNAYEFDIDEFLTNESAKKAEAEAKAKAERDAKAAAKAAAQPLPIPSETEQRAYISKVANELGFYNADEIASKVFSQGSFNAATRNFEVNGKAVQVFLREWAKAQVDLVKPGSEAHITPILEEAHHTSNFTLLDSPLLRQQFRIRYGAPRYDQLLALDEQIKDVALRQVAIDKKKAEYAARFTN